MSLSKKAVCPLSDAERGAMEGADVAFEAECEPLEYGWRAARDYYRTEAEQRIQELTKALLAVRADIVGVNTAAFDSTRGEVAVRAIQRIDEALASDG